MMIAQKQERPSREREPFANHHHNVSDFPTSLDSSKALATLKAQFALAGHQVHEGSNDDFIVCRWGLVTGQRELGAAEAFLVQISGTTP